MGLATAKAEMLAWVTPEARFKFNSDLAVWRVHRVVERGAIVSKLATGEHEHLAEWITLLRATSLSQPAMSAGLA